MAAEGDSIIFLDRNRLFIYDANNILRLDLPPQVARDLDIIDRSGFDSVVDSFIKAKKLNPGNLWIVLSDAICFSKDIPLATDTTKLENDVKDFLEAVPFDQIISKRFRSQTGVRIIAANLEFVEAVIEIFERNGFDAEAVTPAAIFPGYNTKKVLDADFARFIVANKSLVRQGNMLARVAAPAAPVGAPESPKKNKLLPYLIIGFVVLVIILVLAITMRK